MNCVFSNSDCKGDLKFRMPLSAIEKSASICEYHWTLRQNDVRLAAANECTCWEGYERVPGTKPCAPGSCRKVKKSSDSLSFCPACGERQAECKGHADDAYRSLILQKHGEGSHVYCHDNSSCSKKVMAKMASKENLIDDLNDVLGNAFSMYVRAHGAHWNVRGSDFAQYHELFETIYEDIYDSIDPLAENVRKLGGNAPASLNDFNLFDGLKEAPVSGTSEQVLVQDLVDANRIVLESLDKAFKTADAENEQGIANFLAERIDMHQKWMWQLTASMES